MQIYITFSQIVNIHPRNILQLFNPEILISVGIDFTIYILIKPFIRINVCISLNKGVLANRALTTLFSNRGQFIRMV